MMIFAHVTNDEYKLLVLVTSDHGGGATKSRRLILSSWFFSVTK